MKTHNIPYQFNIIQRVTVATLNIVLTILHHVCEWDKDELKDFEERYTKMARLARAKEKYTLEGIKDTRARMDITLTINQDIKETPSGRLIQETWRQCLYVALTVLKINNSKEALWSVADLFSEYMDALTDSRTGAFKQAVMTSTMPAAEEEESIERQQAAIDLLNETMRYTGRKEV